MKISKRFFLITLSLMVALSSCSQKNKKKPKKIKPGHKIVFEIKGLENQELLIAYHHSSKHYISDTLQLDENGIGILQGDDFKPKGVYLAVMPSLKNKYFEFLVSEQYFSVKTDVKDIANKLVFEGSRENDIFTTDMKKMAELRNKTNTMRNQAKTADEKTKKKVEEEIQSLNKAFVQNRDKLAEDNPDMFYTDLLGLMKEVEIPEPPKKKNGELVDSSFGWKYWKAHYWDYTDFAEPGILRTPIFHKKLIEFMDKRTAPMPDSLIASAHKVINLAKQNDEVFQFTLVTLLNKYASSKIMGDDAIYVDLVNTYYKTDQATWTDSAQLAKMIERADALAPLLLGNISPDLVMRDTTLKMKYRLHDLPSDYTIVFVWDPECGHCKKAAPVMRDFYNKYKDKSILVYSIATVNYQEIDEWKKFIKEKNLNFINVADPYVETKFRTIYDIASTPQIFVLDKDKKIIAKRIGANQLEQFFFNYFKRFDKPKFKGMEDLTFEKEDSTKAKH